MQPPLKILITNKKINGLQRTRFISEFMG